MAVSKKEWFWNECMRRLVGEKGLFNMRNADTILTALINTLDKREIEELLKKADYKCIQDYSSTIKKMKKAASELAGIRKKRHKRFRR